MMTFKIIIVIRINRYFFRLSLCYSRYFYVIHIFFMCNAFKSTKRINRIWHWL